MKHIVNFSGGFCSFFAAHRVVQRYGILDTVLLFADTLVEDDDTYEFLERSSELLGVPLTRISAELTPWDLFRCMPPEERAKPGMTSAEAQEKYLAGEENKLQDEIRKYLNLHGIQFINPSMRLTGR
jgi:3'-phosphoadenosine 5'-phosphosulfate sulfotransferase (PAPS reductase)/FAD synthetase